MNWLRSSHFYLKYWPSQWWHLTLEPLWRLHKWREVIRVGPKKVAIATWDEMPWRRLWSWTLTSITVREYCWSCSVNGSDAPALEEQNNPLPIHLFIICGFLDFPHSLNYFLFGLLLRQFENHYLEGLAKPHFHGSMMSADELLGESWQIATMTRIFEMWLLSLAQLFFFLEWVPSCGLTCTKAMSYSNFVVTLYHLESALHTGSPTWASPVSQPWQHTGISF